MEKRTFIFFVPAVLLIMLLAGPALATDFLTPDPNETGRMPYIDPEYPVIPYTPPPPEFAWKTPTGWQNETIPDFIPIDLAVIGEDGYPRIITSNWTLGTVRCAWKDPAGWHSEEIPVSGYGSSIALDPAGEPHLTAYNWETEQFTYAWRANGSWMVEPVPGLAYADMIAYDLNGVPSMARYQWEDKTMIFTQRTASGWQSEVLPFTAIPSALTIPSDGIPRMIYTLETGILPQAVDTMPGRTDESVPEGMEKELPPEGGYVEPVIPPIGYAWKDAAGWHNETIDSSGYLHAVTYSPLNVPALLYGDGYSGALKYAWKDESGWHTESTPFSGYAYGMWSDSTAGTRTAYSDYQDGSLHYAYRDSSGWHEESSGVTYADMARFDQAGNLHVLSTNWETGVVTYSVRIGAGWQHEALPYTGYAYLFGTDRDGFPRMIYNSGMYYPLLAYGDAAGSTGVIPKNGPWRDSSNQTPSAVPIPTNTIEKSSNTTTGSIRLVSFPRSASVTIGTEKKGTTPVLLEGLAPGAVSVKIEAPGFDTWKKTLTIRPGRTNYPGKIILVPSAVHTGSISLASVPMGAQVFVDGKETGLTPLTVKGLSPGPHVVNMTVDGYPTWTKRVEVKPGKMFPVTRYFKNIQPVTVKS